MKKIFLYVLSLTVMLAVSCTGDTGPMGPEGPPGEGGEAEFGQSWEQDVDFLYDEGEDIYFAHVDIPENIDYNFYVEGADDDFSDNLIVYQMGGDGEGVVFFALPRSIFVKEGTLQYGYNFVESRNEAIELTIMGDFNLKNLSDDFVSKQSFRFAVVPSVIASDPNINQGTFKDLENSGLELRKLN